MAFLELHKANIGYSGVTVLHEITLHIEHGERVALLGESGAGKSTLLQTLYRQNAAQATLVPQDFALVRTLSVFHNVYMGRLHRHRTAYNLVNLVHPLRREVSAVRPVVASLGLEDKLYAPVGALSGGQQQRTAVGRSLFQGGAVLMGDEPVSSVDPLQSRQVLEAINAAFPTVVLAMHDVELALAYTDRVVGLENGRIVLDQRTAGLRATDLHGLYRAS